MSSSEEENIMVIRERNITAFKKEFQKEFGTEPPVIKNENTSHKLLSGKKFIKISRNEKFRRSQRIKKNDRNSNDEAEEAENFVSLSQIRRSNTPKIKLNLPHTAAIKPEEVTEEMLEQISYKSVGKTYDAVSGTTCHQCRQKTKDVKSICRGKSCKGIRGQFCGFCLWKRYGENVAETLKDPEWQCPVCRNICNCSLCRAKLGKRPTGILVPIVEKNGFKSVKDFLDNCVNNNNNNNDNKSDDIKKNV